MAMYIEEYPPDWWDSLMKFNVGPIDDGQGGEVFITGAPVWSLAYFESEYLEYYE